MEKKPKKKYWYHLNSKILSKWIISGCFILLIPMTCIIINFFYTQKLLTKKINESNRVTLSSTRYNIDNYLKSLLDFSKYIVLNNSFSNKALNASTDDLFINRIIACKQILNNYKQINPEMDILVYFPNRNYIVTPETANYSKNIYDTIARNFRGEPTFTFEEWKNMLESQSNNQFFIDSKYSYHNYGIDSIVFSSDSTFIYEEKNKFRIYTSIPCSIMDELLKDNPNSVVSIINKDGSIVKQLSSNNSSSVALDNLPINIDSNFGFSKFKIDNNSYVCSYEMSSIYDWYYAIYTPTSLYLKASINLRNVSMFTIGLTLLLGISSIIYLQFRNYKPLSKLVARLPLDIKRSDHNEFDLIETYYQVLYEENESMKTTIQSQQSYAKDVFLLSKLKGRKFLLSDSDISEYLDWEQDNKQFAIAAFSLNINDEEMTSKHFDLITFSLENVLSELLEDNYVYKRVIDEIFIVYVFVFDSSKNAVTKWDTDCKSKFQQLYEFFRDVFKIDLSITLSDVFYNFENISEYYNKVLDVFTYRYVIEQYGVLSTNSLENMDISLVETLQNYRKEVIGCVTKKDSEATKLLVEQLFNILDPEDEPFIMVKYYLLSIISELLLVLRNSHDYHMLKDNLTTSETSNSTLDNHLKQLSNSTTTAQALNEFINILMLLCGELKPSITDSNICSEDCFEDDKFIKKIKSYVNDNYNDPDMNISGISDAIGLSPKYMSKLFKEKTNEGLLIFINMVRINHAKNLLRETNLTVDDISEQTGFTNSRSFRRNFLKIVGMNPTDFRK